LNKKVEQIKNVRNFLLDQIKDLTTEQLNEIPAGFNNNVIWNLAHIISAQQGVCYARADLPIVVEEKYFGPYRPSKKPEHFIDDAEVAIIKKLLIVSIEKFEQDLEDHLFVRYSPWLARPYGIEVTDINDAMDFLIYHEGLHAGYIIAMKHLL
jgi:hypothetical protein